MGAVEDDHPLERLRHGEFAFLHAHPARAELVHFRLHRRARAFRGDAGLQARAQRGALLRAAAHLLGLRVEQQPDLVRHAARERLRVARRLDREPQILPGRELVGQARVRRRRIGQRVADASDARRRGRGEALVQPGRRRRSGGEVVEQGSVLGDRRAQDRRLAGAVRAVHERARLELLGKRLQRVARVVARHHVHPRQRQLARHVPKRARPLPALLGAIVELPRGRVQLAREFGPLVAQRRRVQPLRDLAVEVESPPAEMVEHVLRVALGVRALLEAVEYGLHGDPRVASRDQLRAHQHVEVEVGRHLGLGADVR